MNDDKENANTFKENNSPSNGGNKGVTSSGSGGVGGSSGSDSHHHFSSMGPNHNNNNHQYLSGNTQHHGHGHQDTLTQIGAGSGLTINSNNSPSNDGITCSSHQNNNNANGISNGNKSSSSNNFSSEVCRDFLRNVCRRGANCRYRHPEGSEAEELGKKVDLIFCHDFQNKECRRSNCRFIHCTKQEQEIYRVTGKLPSHLIEKLHYSRLTASSSPTISSASFHHHNSLHQSQHQQQTDFIKSVVCDNSPANGLNSNSSIASTLASSFASSLSSVACSSTVASPFSTSVPVCKDNLKGDCLRGLRCKFRHISQAEYDLELRSPVHSSSGARPSPMDRNHFHHHVPPPHGSLIDGPTSYSGGLAPPEPKRRAYDASLGFGPQPPLNNNLPPSHSQRAISSFNHQGLPLVQPSNSNDFEFSKPLPHETSFNSRYLEEENFTLRRHIEELKKQVSDLMASNEFLIEQNAQLRILGNRSTTSLPPSLHSSSTTSIPQLAHANESFTGSISDDHHYQHQQHLPVGLATSLSAQTTGGISMAVSSMAALSTNVISNSTNPLVSYPIMTTTIQSLRPPIVPHSLSH